MLQNAKIIKSNFLVLKTIEMQGKYDYLRNFGGNMLCVSILPPPTDILADIQAVRFINNYENCNRFDGGNHYDEGKMILSRVTETLRKLFKKIRIIIVQ